jgi:hypothetical protein
MYCGHPEHTERAMLLVWHELLSMVLITPFDSDCVGDPSGSAPVTVPVLFGSLFVTPIVTEYLSRYPEVSASCLFLDRVVKRLDLAIERLRQDATPN